MTEMLRTFIINLWCDYKTHNLIFTEHAIHTDFHAPYRTLVRVMKYSSVPWT